MQKNNKEKNTVKRKLVLEVDRLVKQKYLNLIGFAAKSGKIAYGEEDVLNGIEKGKISLTIIAKDMPEKAKNRMEKKLIHAYENLYFEISGLKEKEDIRVIIVGTKEENSSAVGKVNKPVIGIKDRNLAKGIITSILEEIDGE
ncbi:MAG: ribosomal L7Ae/L30e/S12e/Gadd45 family protein [Clostridiales bacterium]|nr:ribosomal L7Ae/L30e/S12e/Gadd45 family protein [Clostridiales bacterium]